MYRVAQVIDLKKQKKIKPSICSYFI